MIKAPEIGGPIKIPIPQIAKAMPIRTPNFEKSVVKLAIVAGGSDTKAPLTNPYKMAKTIKPAREFIRIHAKMRIVVTALQGIRMLSGPVLLES